jgi:hypothetical protein
VQEDALVDVRDRAHVDQLPFLALARGAGDHARHRDAGDRAQDSTACVENAIPP